MREVPQTDAKVLFYFWPQRTTCRILVPQAGIESSPSAVKAPSPDHWTTRKFSRCKGGQHLSETSRLLTIVNLETPSCPRSNTRGHSFFRAPTAAKGGDSGLLPGEEWVGDSSIEGAPLLRTQKNV